MNGEDYDFENYYENYLDLNELVGYDEGTGEYLLGGLIRVDDKGVPLNFVWGSTYSEDEMQWLFFRLSNLIYHIRTSEDFIAKTGEELIDFIGNGMNEMIENRQEMNLLQ